MRVSHAALNLLAAATSLSVRNFFRLFFGGRRDGV